MTTIERIKLPEPDTHCFDDDTNSDVWSYSPELVREIVPAHIDNLEAEIHASDLAVAEYRQQCLDNAQEIARLRAESEERLQNCVALGAENERLRKDAERKPMTDEDILRIYGLSKSTTDFARNIELFIAEGTP